MKPVLLAGVLALLAVPPALAEGRLPVEPQLLTGWREDGRHVAGLRLTLDPGWKTYWRAPGEAGIPPVIDWSGSTNLAGGAIVFPVPDVFDVAGFRTIGYEGEVILPLLLTPEDARQPIGLTAEVQLGVCDDVCIPVGFTVSARLVPDGGARDPRLVAALADLPRGGGRMTCRITPIADGLRLEVEMPRPDLRGTFETVVETSDPSVWVSPPEVSVEGARVRAVAELVAPDAVPFALERDGLRVTHLAGGQAVELLGCD